MQYALGTATEATEPYTTSIPSKTEAGTYHVWYKVVGDENHNETLPECVEATISVDPADRRAVDAVEARINKLDDVDDIDESDEKAITFARTAYELLTDLQKTLVDEDLLDKLEAAEQKLAEVKQAQREKAAAKDELSDLIEQAKAKSAEDFTAASWAEANLGDVSTEGSAIKQANDVLENNDATTDQIRSAKDSLQAALDKLVTTKAEAKAELDQAIKDAQAELTNNPDKYTDASVATLQTAIEDATEVLGDKDATKRQYEKAKEALVAAKDALKTKEAEAAERAQAAADQAMADAKASAETAKASAEEAAKDPYASDQDKRAIGEATQAVEDALQAADGLPQDATAQQKNDAARAIEDAVKALGEATDAANVNSAAAKAAADEAAGAAAQLAAAKASAAERLDDYSQAKARADFTEEERTDYNKAAEDGRAAIDDATDTDAVAAALADAKRAVDAALAKIEADRAAAAAAAEEMAAADKALADARASAEGAKAAADEAMADEYASDDDKALVNGRKADVEDALQAADGLPQDATAQQKNDAARAIEDAVAALGEATDAANVNSAAAKAAADEAAGAAAQLAAAKETACGRLDDYSEAKALTDATDAEKKAYEDTLASGKAAINEAADKDAVATELTKAKRAVDATLAKIQKDRADAAAASSVGDMINALPEGGAVKTADRPSIEAARAAYDALDDTQKALVDAGSLKKLADAETALAVAQAMGEVSAKTGSAMTYTGNPIQLVNAPTSALPEGHAMRYALGKDATTAPEEGWGEDVPTGSNAGTYHVWYKAVSDKDQGDSEPACTKAVIAKAQSSVGKAPAAIKRTYNGKAQTLVNAGAAQGGTMQYSLDNKSFSDEPPVATDAGTYTVWYRVKGDANHTDVAAKSVKATIAAAKVAPPKPTNHTYNGSAQTGVAKNAGYKLSGTVKATNVGTYKATATLASGYVWSDGTAGAKTLTWKIGPASIGKASISSIATQAYTGKAITPKPTVKVGNKTLKPNVDYTLSYKSNVKAGTATVTITGKGNYAGTRSQTFKIAAPSVQYFVHRQTYGWEDAWSKANGQESGTTGQSKRLEGIRIRLGQKPLSGSIQYRTHIQSYGWEKGWKADGAMSGTSGESKRLEAIQIRLTGDMAKHYDVYYRVHAQQFGWMGWAKNGEQAGTAGFSYRLEAIQIVLVPKGAKAPAATYRGAQQLTARAFAEKSKA